MIKLKKVARIKCREGSNSKNVARIKSRVEFDFKNVARTESGEKKFFATFATFNMRNI